MVFTFCRHFTEFPKHSICYAALSLEINLLLGDDCPFIFQVLHSILLHSKTFLFNLKCLFHRHCWCSWKCFGSSGCIRSNPWPWVWVRKGSGRAWCIFLLSIPILEPMDELECFCKAHSTCYGRFWTSIVLVMNKQRVVIWFFSLSWPLYSALKAFPWMLQHKLFVVVSSLLLSYEESAFYVVDL